MKSYWVVRIPYEKVIGRVPKGILLGLSFPDWSQGSSFSKGLPGAVCSKMSQFAALGVETQGCGREMSCRYYGDIEAFNTTEINVTLSSNSGRKSLLFILFVLSKGLLGLGNS